MPVWIPNYSKSQIDKAGKGLIDPDISAEELSRCFYIVADWRAAHAYPLMHMSRLLRTHARHDPAANVVHRLKRERTIGLKLIREHSRLSQLQDIAGCRAIMGSMDALEQTVRSLQNSRTRHHLVRIYDYIRKPKLTGYRSVHLVYTFESARFPALNGLKTEVQIRTHAQHLWASAVELSSYFRGEDLKDGQGDADWLRFFQLVSGLFAIVEQTAPVPGTSEEISELVREIRDIEKRRDLLRRISAYRSQLDIDVPAFEFGWYLLEMDFKVKRTSYSYFAVDHSHQALNLYAQREEEAKDKPNIQTALVSAQSFAELKNSYASYFGNAFGFCVMIERILDPAKPLEAILATHGGAFSQTQE